MRLVKLQTVRGIGTKHYFQFEVTPSGAADHTLKTFEGAEYEELAPILNAMCHLASANTPLHLQPCLLHFPLNKFKISLSFVLGSVGSYFILVTFCFQCVVCLSLPLCQVG